MSMNLATLFSGGVYQNLTADLHLTLTWPRVTYLGASADGFNVVLPNENAIFSTDGQKYIFLNSSAHFIWVKYNSTPLYAYDVCSVNAADQSFSNASGALNIAPPNSWISTSGFSNGANNGNFQVSQRLCDGSKIIMAGGSGLVNESYSQIGPPPVNLFFQVAAICKIPANSLAILTLGYNPVRKLREWYACLRSPFPAPARSFVHATASAFLRNSICVAQPTPPPPPPPPPPYIGSTPDLSSCPSSLGVTISGGTGVGAIWNGAWRLTKTFSSSTNSYYYRYVIDNNHWVDLRAYTNGGGYGYAWQVICTDNTTVANKRFGNNTVATCPPYTTYTCFPNISDPADCTTGGTLTCVVSA